MVNRETCGVKGVYGFLQRQMLTVRLHNIWWWAVVGHGLITTGVLALCCLTGLAAAVTLQGSAAALIGAAVAAYWAAMLVMVLPLEWCARRVVRARGEAITGFGLRGWLDIALAIPLAQVVHFAALATAAFARTHLWRGVYYRFRGPTAVRVVEDRAEAA